MADAAALNLPLSLVVVFGSAKLLAELFERLKQPAIVGEILAGVLIGPSVLGWIAPNQVLHVLAELGVMFLLFQVGLEVKASELRKVGGPALLAATAGVILPFACGWGIMRLQGAPSVEAMFVGAAMVATSVGITAKVLAERGLLQQRASQVILAAAVIDDVLGLLILAVVSSMARGKVNPVELGLTAAAAIGFTYLMARWGTPAMGRVMPKLDAGLLQVESQFNLAMIFLFAMALLATYAGVAAIVGAFLAGMALSETVEKRVHDMTHGVTELMVPFFLAGIGLNLDINAFGTRATLVLALVILAAAVVSKLVGCGLGALSLGRADAWRVGCGMIPRGEVGMVVAQLGLGLGVVPKDIYAVVVFMSVATTLIAPPLLNLSFRGVKPQTA
ncbi:MAG: cation:proton antiporter [Acidobacteria bacterium]|nr:cation:proton antiporter [Acidobacteriota bacterium]